LAVETESWDGALFHAAHAIATKPQDPAAYLLRGRVRQKQARLGGPTENLTAAVEDLTKALNLGAQFAAVAPHLASAYEELEQWDKLAAIYQRLIPILPGAETERVRRAIRLRDNARSLLRAGNHRAAAIYYRAAHDTIASTQTSQTLAADVLPFQELTTALGVAEQWQELAGLYAGVEGREFLSMGDHMHRAAIALIMSGDDDAYRDYSIPMGGGSRRQALTEPSESGTSTAENKSRS
jgi:tetratricopeptide (TPR) repeat protein